MELKLNEANKVKLIMTSIFSIVLLLSIHFLYRLSAKHLDLINYYFKGFQLIFVIDIFIVSIKLNNTNLNKGFMFIIGALLLDFSNQLIIDINIINSSVLILYYIMIIFGMYYMIKGKDHEVQELQTLNIKLNNLVHDLTNIAYHNPITNLPNRNYLLSFCNFTDLSKCKKCDYCLVNETIIKNNQVGLLFFDLDDFKLINDYAGHANGDILLKIVGERLKSTVGKDDTVIHLSGDEFLIFINNFDEIEKITNEIMNYINSPFIVNNREILVSCSIGISFYPKHGNNLDVLMKKADIAMYEAKRTGKSNYYIFNDNLENEFDNRYNLIHELKNAIKNNEFTVYYQPKAHTSNNEITGLEALVRWNHPKHGIVYPNDFIPLAEELGIISKIDQVVLRMACQQINQWIVDGKKPYNISVNISPQFFMSSDFLTKVDNLLTNFKNDANYLSFEITENIALNNIEKTKEILISLKARNIKIYIDDFGKGYSSLTYIKEFNFDYLKIDKAFIDGIPHNNVDVEIIAMIINLSKLFDFKIIYEGVESQEQLEFLKKLGLHEYQGYLLSKPQTIDKIALDFKNR